MRARRHHPRRICLSKALTAGYLPLGVTAATDAVYDAFLSQDRTKTFFHGHSFTANPLACAVAIASLDLFHETQALERVRQLEGRLRAGLEPLSRSSGCRGRPRDWGRRDHGARWRQGQPSPPADTWITLARGWRTRFSSRGLLLRPLGNVLYFMPPYVISESETAWAIQQIREVLSDLRI